MTLYSMRDVTKHRAKGDVAFLLKIPEFSLTPGECCAVVGPSGCGKSTFLDMLALVSKPTSSTQFMFHDSAEVDLNTASEKLLARVRRSSLGYILQNGGLLPFLTVEENLRLTLELNSHSDPNWFDELVETLQLSDQLTKKPEFLSGGQRQRVAIGRALMHKPAVILADEPTAAVDAGNATRICEMFKELATKCQTAIILVSHDISLAKSIADTFVTFELSQFEKMTVASSLKSESLEG